MVSLSPEQIIIGFDCGNADLNEFFNQEAIKYQDQLLSNTYFFRHNETGKVICAFSLSPDGLNTSNLPGSRRKKVKELIPREKPLKSYPAILIGRVGVSLDYAGQGIGSQLMDFIKSFCFTDQKQPCRFLLVDAYNEPDVLNFYLKNDFFLIFSTEEQEREYYQRKNTEPLRTRFMFYDMIQWKNKM
jgi:ribosomal protein S18 acetylase RimI-like enzyme